MDCSVYKFGDWGSDNKFDISIVLGEVVMNVCIDLVLYMYSYLCKKEIYCGSSLRVLYNGIF